ncbi:MAG: ABC transporter ATP-binding protein [Planctomycetota bacterium]|nr:ABC transporter ATP-binding protein [Planctomycetota bacterium]
MTSDPNPAPETPAAPAMAVALPPPPPPTQAVPALEILHLSHRFKKHQALQDVSFRIMPACIHGFVGPNGAGKTTTLKVIATLLAPQTGEVRVFGHDVRTARTLVRRRMGFMPDHFSMYRQMTVYEYLDFFAAAYGIDSARRGRIVDDVLALTDMTGRKDDLIKGLSRGMQQRVGLARVLVNDPDLLLLDEPASGLDPRARIELMEILQELKRMGKTIFISSHILTELAQLCDSCTIIDRGQIRYSGSMQGLLAHEGDQSRYVLTLAEPMPQLVPALLAIPGMAEAKPAPDEPARIDLTFDAAATDTSAILRAALDASAKVVSFKPAERHLNQAFMDLTSPGVRS